LQFSAAEKMHVQVKYHLSSFGVAVDYGAKTAVGYFFYFCHFLRGGS